MLRGILRPRRDASARPVDGDVVDAVGTAVQIAPAIFEVVLSAIAEGVLVVDPDGHVIYSNRAATRFLGSQVNVGVEVVPRGLAGLIDEGRSLAHKGRGERLRRQLESGDSVLEVVVLPATPAGALVAILRDVTRTRRTERLRRDFVANASHELKTPVASILALAGAVRAAAAGSNADAMARFSSRLEHAERLAALVGDLL